ncbi:MAG: hypothetical protein FVQ84_06680 [Planctomycetes bacterium]|nr:hypothetical protein [Planctomycetota bacterium]
MIEQNEIDTCIEYTLKVLLGDQSNDVLRKYISYSESEPRTENTVRLCIIPSGLFGEDYGKLSSLPRLPLEEIEGVPLLYGTPQIRREGDRLIIHADIIASTYFLVTRYEEMVRRDVRDEHGRFPGKESLPCRAGFIHRPIVDEYAALLRKWLREAGINIPESSRKFSVLSTHDVDIILKYGNPVRTMASAALGNRPWREVSENLAVWFKLKSDPFDAFDQMLQHDKMLSERNGIRAEVVYFFMSGGQSQFDGMYNIHSKVAKSTIKLVYESGAEIGLHTSYEAGIRPELIEEEKAILEDVCGFPIHCNRYHFLTWREIENGWALAKAGINRDSSLGYADVAGFRLGVCRPIPLFDPIKMQPFGIEEHPLIVMDCTLSRDNYMNLSEEEALSYCRSLIDQTRKHGGEFVMLWHNTVFSTEQSNYHPKLFQKLLRELNYVGEKNEKPYEPFDISHGSNKS